MALTPSNMMPLGTKAPDFTLMDTVSGSLMPLDHLRSDKATVIMFICNHCPYVIHLNECLVTLAKEYQREGVSFIAISSNDVDYVPEDGPAEMKIHAEKTGYPFPYLYDEKQEVARAYDAACTPDFYVFDAELRLAYRGRLDNSRPGNAIPPSGRELSDALDAILSGQKASPAQYPSMGCNIKWKEHGPE
jgi:peroxiredoxin